VSNRQGVRATVRGSGLAGNPALKGVNEALGPAAAARKGVDIDGHGAEIDVAVPAGCRCAGFSSRVQVFAANDEAELDDGGESLGGVSLRVQMFAENDESDIGDAGVSRCAGPRGACRCSRRTTRRSSTMGSSRRVGSRRACRCSRRATRRTPTMRARVAAWRVQVVAENDEADTDDAGPIFPTSRVGASCGSWRGVRGI